MRNDGFMEGDIPNYVAVPLSVLAGFLIALAIRKYYPTEAEEHQSDNQMFLLSKAYFPIYESLYSVNDALKIHESHEGFRNVRMEMSLHPEDEERITEYLEDFKHQRKKIENINSNSVGEFFYNAMIEYFEFGQYVISQGWTEVKFVDKMCHGLAIMKEELVEFEKEYGFKLKVISEGKELPLDFYRNN